MEPGREQELLFGLVAIQLGFIDQGHFAEGFQNWNRKKDQPLSDFFPQLSPDQKSAVSALASLYAKDQAGLTSQLAAIRSLGIPVESARPPEQPQTTITPAISFAEGSINAAPITPGAELDTTHTFNSVDGTNSTTRFRLLRPYARGGLGAVSVALDTEFNREVALKEILNEQADDAQSRARFKVEAELTGRLEHPGIVPVYSMGVNATGRPYYAMRFVKGNSLKQEIAKFHNTDNHSSRSPGERRIALRGLLNRFIDVCNTIAYAHSRGVIHRDLKPSNILLGPFGETLVVDWGLAKVIGRPEDLPRAGEATLRLVSASGSTETQDGMIVGTPSYMSPEQAEGDLNEVGISSDLYSLGATLYCLLTGRPPIEAGNATDALRMVREGDFPSVRQLNPQVPKSLEAICRKAMALRAKDRYASVRELAVEIEHWLADEPIEAYREAASARLGRWMRRNRSIVTAAGVFLVCLSAALAAGMGLLSRSNRLIQLERDQANLHRDQSRENFQRARQAVNTFVSRISEEQLLNQPKLKPLRSDFLMLAMKYYEDFIKEGRNDPTLTKDLAEAHRGIAEITSELQSSPKEAVKSIEKAIELLNSLRANNTRDESVQFGLARCHQLQGLFLLRLKEASAGETALRKAIDLYTPLSAAHPENVDYGRNLGRCYDLLGVVGIVSGDYAQYLPNWDKAIKILNETIARHPTNLKVRSQLSLIHSNRSSSLEGIDNLIGAGQDADVAVSMSKDLTAAESQDPFLQRQLVLAFCMQAGHLDLQGKYLKAATVLEEAEIASKNMVAADPNGADPLKWMLCVDSLLVDAYAGVGKTSRAAYSYRQGKQIAERLFQSTSSPDQFSQIYRADLARNYGKLLGQLNRWDEAILINQSALDDYTKAVKDWSGNVKLQLSRTQLIESQWRTQQLSTKEAKEQLQSVLGELERIRIANDRPRVQEAICRVTILLAEACTDGANDLDGNEKLTGAIDRLESTLRSNLDRLAFRTTLARALLQRAKFHERKQQFAEAATDAAKAVDQLLANAGEGAGYLFELSAAQSYWHSLSIAHPEASAPTPPSGEACFANLKKAVDQGFDNSYALKMDLRISLLRMNPEFESLLKAAEANGRISE